MTKNKKIVYTSFILILIIILVSFQFIYNNNSTKNEKSWIYLEEDINNADFKKKELTDEYIENEKKKKQEEFKRNIKTINLVWEYWQIDLCETINEERLMKKCLDNWYLFKAFETKDIKYCKKINEEANILKCSDELFYHEAISGKNKKICEKISNEITKKSCNETFLLNELENWNFKGDVEFCNSFDWSNKEYCINKISFWSDNDNYFKATEEKNAKYCDLITQEELKNNCFDTIMLPIYIKEWDINNCTNLKNQESIKGCNDDITKSVNNINLKSAIEKSDINYCNKILDIKLVNECFDVVTFNIAIKNNNIEECNKIWQNKLKNECSEILNIN